MGLLKGGKFRKNESKQVVNLRIEQTASLLNLGKQVKICFPKIRQHMNGRSMLLSIIKYSLA